MELLLIIVVIWALYSLYEEIAKGPAGQDDDNPYADWEDDGE